MVMPSLVIVVLANTMTESCHLLPEMGQKLTMLVFFIISCPKFEQVLVDLSTCTVGS
jgi:hypothetical protein